MSSGVGVSPCNVPVYIGGGNLKLIERRVVVVEVILRCLICVLGVVSAVLVGRDTQMRSIFSVEKKAKFTDMKALVFLVITNAVAAGYSLVQGLHCVMNIARGSVFFNKPLSWVIFSCDQTMAYASLAAVAAAAQAAVFSEKGQDEMQWMKLCNLYGKFCLRIGEGMASSTIVSIGLIALSCMSSFSLFRLYGKGKDKSNGC